MKLPQYWSDRLTYDRKDAYHDGIVYNMYTNRKGKVLYDENCSHPLLLLSVDMIADWVRYEIFK